MTVVYDAVTKSYIVTNGPRTQTFAPADLKSALSNGQIAVYEKTAGSSTDSLTLTKPGTSGRLTYKYVGAGFWQRTLQGTNAISGTFDAFTYGVATPAGAITRRGGATYDVDIMGVSARFDTLYSLRGTGVLTVNFLTGEINGGNKTISGLTEVRADGNPLPSRSGEWSMTANLAGSQNAINGRLTMYDSNTDALSGPLSGRLYGPASDEIGLSYAVSNAFGEQAVGAVVGRRSGDTIAADNPSLTDLQFDQTLSVSRLGYTEIRDASGQVTSRDTFDGRSMKVAYQAAGAGFGVSEEPFTSDILTTVFHASDIKASASDARYTQYEKSVGADTYSMRYYNNGPGNDEIALTYSSFIEYVHVKPVPGQSSSMRIVGFAPIGIRTPLAAVPRTGSANYAGIVRGEGVAPGMPAMALEGTANFTLDFANSIATGHIVPVLVDRQTGTRYTYGALDSSDQYRTAGVAQIEFSAGGKSGPGGLQASAAASMTFMGPHAEEVAGTFGGTYVPPGENFFSGNLLGVVVARKTP